MVAKLNQIFGYFKIKLGAGSTILNGNLTMNGRALDPDINSYFIRGGVNNPTLKSGNLYRIKFYSLLFRNLSSLLVGLAFKWSF